MYVQYSRDINPYIPSTFYITRPYLHKASSNKITLDQSAKARKKKTIQIHLRREIRWRELIEYFIFTEEKNLHRYSSRYKTFVEFFDIKLKLHTARLLAHAPARSSKSSKT